MTTNHYWGPGRPGHGEVHVASGWPAWWGKIPGFTFFFFKYGRQKVQLSKMVVEDVEVYLSIKHSCLTINNDGLANSFGDLQRWKWHMVRMNWAWVNIGET
jgi:hypothetical protein